MTAVEYLFETLWDCPKDKLTWYTILEKAKGMEKQQIIDAFYQCGRDNFEHIKVINRSATEYYNETYGSKGSGKLAWCDDDCKQCEQDATSSQTEISDEEWVGCDGCTETDEYFWKKGFQAGYNKAKPVEISDEEIREQGIKYDNQALSETPIAHFMEGAFWYREQLKKKQ